MATFSGFPNITQHEARNERYHLRNGLSADGTGDHSGTGHRTIYDRVVKEASSHAIEAHVAV